MFSPPLYIVRKFSFRHLMNCDFHLELSQEEDQKFHIKQQDNLLFRQIRLITQNISKFNPYVVFVDCKGSSNYKDELSRLVLDGLYLNGKRFIVGESSASMTRTSMLSFVDESISETLEQRVRMGINLNKTVLSKYYAYRGLLLSSCHCLTDWLPKIVIVPDYYRVIPAQKIKYVYDNEIPFTDKDGNQRVWKQKDISQTIKDIEINVFDGCGIHHPAISQQVKQIIGSKTDMTSILWRAPYIKGVTHEVDYESYFYEFGVTHVEDIWGTKHDLKEPMIIMTESMYKGKKYFQNHNDFRDWQYYWEKFQEFSHCIGVAKWNFSKDEEPIYTRANYQILQDLNLPYDEFAKLAKKSVDVITRIVNGDPVATYCFLGLYSDRHKPLNGYTRAILKNPEMLKESGVRNYLIHLIDKYRDEMKCGKLWLKSCFKFLVPDLMMFLQHIAGQEITGCLQSDEFYSNNIYGDYSGEFLIERNPHICKSEHVILKAISPPETGKYFSNLSNICMINGNSITPQRLNGADFDGDLVLVVDNKIMKSGVDRKASIVMDIDDKITCLEELDTKENRLSLILRTMNNLIGETSNCATAYHNKIPKSKESKEKYESYVDLLSVVNGKAIDFAKTGVLFQIPRHIAKYGRPLPYFMRYAGEYYMGMKKLSKSRSNLNRLCWDLEKWDRSIRYKRNYSDFDYTIMIDLNIGYDSEHFAKIEEIYLTFCKEMEELAKDQAFVRNYDFHSDELQGVISRNDAKHFMINWQFYYDKYKKLCMECCSDQRELANIAVILCYEKYPKKNRKFLWRVAEDGILKNLKQTPVRLPIRSDNGAFEYLGNRYDLVECKWEEII